MTRLLHLRSTPSDRCTSTSSVAPDVRRRRGILRWLPDVEQALELVDILPDLDEWHYGPVGRGHGLTVALKAAAWRVDSASLMRRGGDVDGAGGTAAQAAAAAVRHADAVRQGRRQDLAVVCRGQAAPTAAERVRSIVMNSTAARC